MINFKFYCELTEAMIITKKASEVELEPGQAIRVLNYEVIPTEHVKEPRKGVLRDNEISKKTIIDSITKAHAKGLKDLEGNIHIIYKNGNRYNDFIVFKKKNKLTIKTIIADNRSSPDKFKTYAGDEVIITEKYSGIDLYCIVC